MEPEIAPEAEGSFLEGSLVLMLFDPHNDSGFYKCEVEYTATSVGENSIYDRALYEIVATSKSFKLVIKLPKMINNSESLILV